jgi:hypothetical protein
VNRSGENRSANPKTSPHRDRHRYTPTTAQQLNSNWSRSTETSGHDHRNAHCGIKGFVHPFSLFLAWIEINGRLFEVEPMIRIRDDQEQCQVAMSDLVLMGEYKRNAAAAQRAHGHAAMGEAEALFYKLTGTRWDAADRINGRAKRPKKTEHVPTASTLPKKRRA